MDWQKFKRTLNTIVEDKSSDDLGAQMDPEKGGEKPNVFMSYRWLSMDEKLLQSVADVQVSANKYLTPEQEMLMMLHCTDEAYDFRPRYIKKK
jgi:hypothetical protein